MYHDVISSQHDSSPFRKAPSTSRSVFVCLDEIDRFRKWMMFEVRFLTWNHHRREKTAKLVKQVYLPALMCVWLQTSADICAEQHLGRPTDLIWVIQWCFTSASPQKPRCCVRDLPKLAQLINLQWSGCFEKKRKRCSGICVAMQPRGLVWPWH